MELEGKFLRRVAEWESMSRWERSELGRDLRRLGFSYGEIMELIPVKKSTLATWCREVGLTEGADRRDQRADVSRSRSASRHRAWQEPPAVGCLHHEGPPLR